MSQAIRKCAQFATLTAAVLLYGQAASAAPMVYATIEGTKMGVFKGDSTRAGLQDKTEVLKYEYSVSTPVSATGQATGKRQHGVLRITKAMGPASPQLFQALINNENLKTVALDFLGISNTTGQEYLQTTIRLTNAKVVGFEQVHVNPAAEAPSAKATSAGDIPTLEQVSFSFQTIEMISHVGKTSALDSLAAL